MHMIKTKNLKAATVYAYQVGATTSNGTEWGPELEFHTASKENEFSFLSIGDLVCIMMLHMISEHLKECIGSRVLIMLLLCHIWLILQRHTSMTLLHCLEIR